MWLAWSQEWMTETGWAPRPFYVLSPVPHWVSTWPENCVRVCMWCACMCGRRRAAWRGCVKSPRGGLSGKGSWGARGLGGRGRLVISSAVDLRAPGGPGVCTWLCAPQRSAANGWASFSEPSFWGAEPQAAFGNCSPSGSVTIGEEGGPLYPF